MSAKKAPSGNTTDLAGRDAAVLSAVEVGLGSVLHGFKIPLSGHFLSLNQGFLLSRSVMRARGLEGARRLPLAVSSITAVLKSLAPAGKKLTPMLAISAQGLLFSLGTLVFGANLAGVVIGSVIASVWAFVQPVLIYYFLFGTTMLEIGEYLYDKSREALDFNRGDLLAVVLAMAGIKAVAAAAAAVLAHRLPGATAKRYEDAMLKAGTVRRKRMLEPRNELTVRAKAWLALKDVFNPLFVVSLGLTALFFLFVEASANRLIWALLRPVAVGFVLFFAIRLLPFERILTQLDGTRLSGFSRSFKTAIQTLRSL